MIPVTTITKGRYILTTVCTNKPFIPAFCGETLHVTKSPSWNCQTRTILVEVSPSTRLKILRIGHWKERHSLSAFNQTHITLQILISATNLLGCYPNFFETERLISVLFP